MVRLAIAAIAACTTAALLYAALRIVQALILTEPDPALVIWSEHAGFFWRGWTAIYGGGMVGFITWLVAARHAARTARVLARAITVIALLVVLQGLLVP